MLKVFLLLIVSVVLIQVSAAETVTERAAQNISALNESESRFTILQEMTEKVLELRLYALNAAAKETMNINESKKQINYTVQVSLENISGQISDLEDLIKNATIKAEQRNKTISTCIRNERRSKWFKIRSDRIVKCQKAFSSDVLKLKIGQLADVEVKAASIIPSCRSLHPLGKKYLKDCIQKKMDDTYLRTDNIKSNLEADAAKIYNKASHCIEDNLEDLDLDIEQIALDFKKCIRKKLK